MLVSSLHLSVSLSLAPLLPSQHTLPFPPPPLFLCSLLGSQCHAPASRPASPQPIRLTKPVLKQTSAADIVLEKPIETGWVVLSLFLFHIISISDLYYMVFEEHYLWLNTKGQPIQLHPKWFLTQVIGLNLYHQSSWLQHNTADCIRLFSQLQIWILMTWTAFSHF